MAGVIKSKGNQVFTAQVRSVNTDTGSGYVTEALQRASARISDSLYRQAVSQQQRAGQEFARNQIITSVKDPDGTPRFIDAYDDLSQVAQDTARPLIERKYASAFGRDVENMLIDVRAKAKNSTDFETLATVELQGLLDAVPPDFEFAAKDSLENSGSLSLLQHKQSMVLAEKRAEKQAFFEQEQLRFKEASLTIANLVGNGDLGAAVALRLGLNDELDAGIRTGLYTDQFVSNARNQMDRNYYGTLLMQDANEFLVAGDVESVRKIITALEMNQSYAIPDEDQPLRKDDVDQIRDPATKRAIAADIRREIGNFSGYLSGLADQKFAEEVVTNLADGNYRSDDARSKAAFGDYWAAIGVTQDRRGWFSKRAVALVQDQQGIPHKAIVNGNFLPPVLKGLMDGVASGNVKDLTPEEFEAAITIYQTVTQGIGRAGDTKSDKGFDDLTVTFFDNMDTWINTFGIDAILQGGGIYAGSAGSDRAKAIQDGVVSKLGGRNARESIIDHMREEKLVKGLPAGAVDRLMVIAQPAYAFLSTSEADDMLERAIDAIYAKTDLIKMPDIIGYRAEITRSEFAPERFYSDASSLFVFEEFTNNRIKTVTGRDGVLGEDFFLYPSTQSTNRQIRWFVVDAEGQYLPNSEGRPLVINSSNVNRTTSMQSVFDAALEQKLEEARELRTIATTGMESDTRRDRDEAVEGFNKGVLADE